MSYFREQLENWLKTIDVKTDVVFDVGGKANPIKKRVKSWNVKDYEILDLPEYNLNIKNRVYKKANIIFCLEVMEYIYNPVEAINNLALLLEKGGILYISFPFIYPQHNPTERDFLRYTPVGVEKLLKIGGFGIIEHEYREVSLDNPFLQQFYSIDGMRTAKGLNHRVTGSLIKAKKCT